MASVGLTSILGMQGTGGVAPFPASNLTQDAMLFQAAFEGLQVPFLRPTVKEGPTETTAARDLQALVQKT
jgi:hypothetical protein